MGSDLVELSAVSCGVKDLREAIETSQSRIRQGRGRLTLFVDEIHRLNKSQQDVLLPAMEMGTVAFIGATTENPSFEVNPAILSRTLAYRLERLSAQSMQALLKKTARQLEIEISLDGLEILIRMAQGDARRGLNFLEAIVAAWQSKWKSPDAAVVSVAANNFVSSDLSSDVNHHGPRILATPQLFGSSSDGNVRPDEVHSRAEIIRSLPETVPETVPGTVQKDSSSWTKEEVCKNLSSEKESDSQLNDFDGTISKASELQKVKDHAEKITADFILTLGLDIPLGHGEHYDLASAMIKSIRASHPDAGLYYMARLIEQGDDPLFIARRLVIFASEDIGNANPEALQVATSGATACQLVGFPEARIILSQVLTYLAASPKSNRSYRAINEAIECVKQTGKLPIPPHLLNPVTSFNKKQGIGMGYDYPHDSQGDYRRQAFLPKSLKGKRFYNPSDVGTEKLLRKNLDSLRPHGDD